MPFPSSRTRVVIDGNIGSGKTTQLKLLSNAGLNVKCEPIHEWPLREFYEDKSRWAFLLQMSILKSFVSDEDGADVWERSPESSREVFWKMLRSHDIGTEEEELVYNFFYDRNAWQPDIHMYIRTSPEECYRRLKSRKQTGDCEITLEYLREVHEYYERYVASKPNVIIIDGHQSTQKIQEDIRKKNAEMFRTHKKGVQM